MGIALTMARADTNAPAGEPAATDVPVQHVVLYRSGVGYFEHAGTVTGDARTELRFKTEQINDMLKSLVLQDLRGGRVGIVVYPSQDPLEKTLKSFQVDISGNPSLAELLNQLRGAPVTVEAIGETIEGIILGVEQQERPAGDERPIKVWVLNLLTGGAIRALELNQVRRIILTDPQLQEELNRALVALAQARDQDKKPVAINFHGTGERPVRIGYVIETPIWKTSYRLIMPAVGEDMGKLLGWAIVENQTEADWNDVVLSLVSGRPISFIQDLYQPLYVPRPVVEPELYASLMPQTYREGIEMDEDDAVGRFAGRARRLAAPMSKAMPATPGERAEMDAVEYHVGGAVTGIDAAASVASMATAADVGELFQYTVPSVSLPRQRSAMIPIVTDDVQVERLSIYNQQVMAHHPLNGARLKNTTGNHLLQGPLTVIDDQAYAGDARIDDVPEDQTRLLSYAVDLDVRVNAEQKKDSHIVQTGSLVKGVLHLKRKHALQREYAIENKADRDRKLLIEHPLRSGYTLVDTPKPVETTESFYRFEDTVAAGKKSVLAVSEERVYSETIAVLPADIGQLVGYTRTGEIPQNVRDALAEVIRRKHEMVDTERKINDRRQQITTITEEQNRIRQNMSTVDRNSEYYTRLLNKLNDQETQIEKLQSEVEDLREIFERQRADLETHISNLNVN
jgi:hypothetical protein